MLLLVKFVLMYFVVPTPTIVMSPPDPIQGAMVGSPQDIQCIVSTVSGVELSSVMISWMGPGGESITNDSRVTVSPTTSSGNNYTSSLQFTYLMEGDEGIYACYVKILNTNSSGTVEIENLNGMCRHFILHFVHSETTSVYITTLVPTPTVMITASNAQIVGQSLELTCSGTIIRGITSEVDIVWKSDGIELNRSNGINLIQTKSGTSLMYLNTYNIAQLSTYDKGRVYYCELVINLHPQRQVIVNRSIILNVTSKLQIIYCVCTL